MVFCDCLLQGEMGGFGNRGYPGPKGQKVMELTG
jgi:hypothetical protein